MRSDQVVRLPPSSVECCVQCEMFSPLVFYGLSTLIAVYCKTVTSPQIRILDVATKASETRLIPYRVDHPSSYRPHLRSSPHPHRNGFQQNEGPLKSYVIYDEYPLKVFREWKASSPADFSSPAPQSFPDPNRQPNADFAPDYYYRDGQLLHPPKPTLAYSSVYSNVIKVFDNSLDNVNRDRFSGDGYFKPVEGVWKPQIGYEPVFRQELSHRKPFQNQKLPANFPKVFSPNENFHFPIDDEPPQPPRFFYPQEGFYDTGVINHDRENNQRRPDEVETLPEVNANNSKRPFLCSFIRVNQRQFPENGPCGKSIDDLPITSPEYPDYSNFPNDKIPVEHRRQYFQTKRIKRSEWRETYDGRRKRDAGGFGYGSWGSPFGYESGNYDGTTNSNNYPNRGYSRNRERSQSYRNRYGSRYDDYDDDYQNGDDSNSRGLTGYLTNGGRRYKNRKNNDEDDEDDEYDNESNRDEDSEEEMERMNSNRRDNGRRNNDDSRDRRRNNSNNSNNNNSNNNNNDDDDYRDNRRNRNGRRNNSNRRYNDRYDNNGRNRYYGNSNGYGYNSNGYGNSYLGYGSNYGGYGSGGYGSSYGGNGGYGYGGGYGNFGSF